MSPGKEVKGDAPPRTAGRVLVAACALALLTYATLRAWLTAFTWDESFTFLNHVQPHLWFLRSFDQMGANHHLLNVWAMIAANKLFGNSELALRLPNLLAYGVYLYASARIALEARGTVTAVAAFLLLNAHPYLIDFFGLARGYGMAHGCLMLCLWLSSRYLTQGRKAVHLALASFSLVLAVLSNLVMLDCLIAYTAVMGVVIVLPTFTGRPPIPWRHLAIIAAGAVIALAVQLPTALALSKEGALFFGCDHFWDCSVRTLSEKLLYGSSYGLAALDVMGLALAAIALCCGVTLVAAWRGKWMQRLQPMAFGVGILIGCLVLMGTRHYLMGTFYPRSRTALYLVPLASYMVASGLVAWPGKGALPAVLASALCAPLLFHQWQCANVSYTLEWKPAADVVKMLDIIRRDHAPIISTRPVITVASSLESRESISYYAERDTMQWLVPFPHDSPGPYTPSDYYIVEEGTTDVDTAHWVLLYHSALTGAELYRDRRWREVPHVVHYECQDMESPGIPGRTAETRWRGQYGVRFDRRTRSSTWITWVVTDTLASPNLRLLGTAMIQQPTYGNWISLVVRVVRNGKQVAYTDANSAMQMRHFDQWQQVSLPLNMVQPLLPGDEVHVEAPPYTGETVMFLDDLDLWVLE